MISSWDEQDKMSISLVNKKNNDKSFVFKTFVILPQNFDWFSCQQIYHEKKDHYMPESFKDIPWCQKQHQGVNKRQEMS